MKKVLKHTIFSAIALALALSSCISENILPNPVEEKGYKTVSLHITQASKETETRGISRPVCNGELLEFNSGDLYLYNAATGQIIRHFRIIRAGAAPHNFATGGFINRDLLNFVNATSSALLEIPNVPGNVTHVAIVGNTPHNNTQGNINDVFNRQICITTQHSALTPEGQPQKPGVNLFGMTAPLVRVGDVATGTLLLSPTVARIEIGSIVGTGSIVDFTVEGIFIDNHYRRASVSGVIPNHGDAQPNPNRMGRGTNATLFAPGQPYYSFIIGGPTNSGALFDLRPDNNINTWRGQRAGNVPGAVRPGGITNVTNCTAIGCTNNHSNIPNVWAYHLFAHSAGTSPPNVVIRLSNIRLINETAPQPGYRFLTVSRLYDQTGTAVTSIRSGNTYHIAVVLFYEGDLRLLPND